MPAKKLIKSPSHQTSARKTDGKPAKNVSRKPAAQAVPVQKPKPALKGGEVSVQKDGFIRINEVRLRKVYR